MDFQYSEEEERFRQEVRAFFKKELTAEVRRDSAERNPGPAARDFYRRMGAKGYLSLSWPREYGGQGSYMKELIFCDEASRAGARLSVSAKWAEPMFLLYMTDEQKKEYLPRLARGEIVDVCLGYTEPQAGSDFSATEMRAMEDGDDYILNGQKMFSTVADYADYHLVAARTDPSVPKEEGISFFMVDLKSPGITVCPIWLMGNSRSNEVFYDNVRGPKKNLVGEKNRGWQQWSACAFFLYAAMTGDISAVMETLVRYAKETQREGEPLAKDPIIRQKLAQLAIRVEIARLWGHRLAWMMDEGLPPSYELAMAKLNLDEVKQREPNVGMQILGLYGQLQSGSEEAPLAGVVENLYQLSVRVRVTAGPREILRNIIALRALGLPYGQASATPYYDPKLPGGVEGASTWTTA